MTVTRRRFLTRVGSLAAAAAAVRLHAGETPARPPGTAMRAAIAKVVGDARIHEGRVKLDLPPLIESGNGVPLTIVIDSPMTASDHVKAIHVYTEKNPLPEVVSFHLGPRAGRAQVATRIRLADTQTVIAIAQLSDGTYWSASTHVIVTLAACLEELPS